MPQTSALCPPNDQPCRISIPKCKRIEHQTFLAPKLRIGNGGQKTTRGHNYFLIVGGLGFRLPTARAFDWSSCEGSDTAGLAVQCDTPTEGAADDGINRLS